VAYLALAPFALNGLAVIVVSKLAFRAFAGRAF
jgi:hypothetical protein